MNNRIFTQGGIYIVSLEDCIGSEQSGLRPCVVVSNKKACIYSPVITIVPITSQPKKPICTHFILSNKKYPCLKRGENIVLCEQIRTVSIQRILNFIGEVSLADLKEIKNRINENISIEEE